MRRCSVGCGVAQQGAALLSRVRRCSLGCGVAQLGYGVPQLVPVPSASGCCKTGPSSILVSAPKGVFSTELAGDEEIRTSAKFAANGDGIMCCKIGYPGMYWNDPAI